jgi:hypothetical protein
LPSDLGIGLNAYLEDAWEPFAVTETEGMATILATPRDGTRACGDRATDGAAA